MTKALSFGSDGKLLEFVPQISDMSGLQNSLDGKANLSGGNTLTGTQTFRAAATQDSIKIAGRAGGTSSYSTTITPLALSANRTLSAPDADGTIATLSAQTFTGAQRFPAGTAAAPSILLDDVDTGFYRAGTNQIGISCAGKTIATITSANWLHYGFGIELPIDIVRANGTETAPTKVLSGESLGRYGFRSYYDDGIGGAGYSIVGCAIRSIATEDHNSNTNLGQQFEIRTVVNGAGSATTRAIVFNQGTLGVGLVSGAGATYISPASIANNAPKLQSLGTSSAGDSAYLQARFDATAGDCPQHVLAKSRGTALADYTAVASGNTLGIIAGEGADGTEFIRAGSIRCVVDGTVSTGVVPGSWVIYTNNASGTAVQAVKIGSDQTVTIAGSTCSVADKMRMHYDSTTGERGTQIKITNRTGETSVKGKLVHPSSTNDNSVELVSAASPYTPCGVIYQSGIANGSDMWIWCPGSTVEFLMENNDATTRQDWLRASDTTNGRVQSSAVPTPPNADSHFAECGHALESNAGGTDQLVLGFFHVL
jgi:hypothetical protein